METALISGHVEEGQLFDLYVGVVVYTLGPDGPVASSHSTVSVNLLTSFVKQHLKLIGGEGEYLAESVANGIYLAVPKRIVLLKGSCLEVYENPVFWNTAGHQLSITAENVASVGLHAY